MKGSCSSLASMYSGVGEEFLSEVSGEIQLQLHYDNKSATLEIHVLQCQELKTADSKKKSTNPYVKTYLLPDRSLQGKRKTRHKRGTLNPAFNEILTVKITENCAFLFNHEVHFSFIVYKYNQIGN